MSLSNALRNFLRFLRYPFCQHRKTIIKTAGTRAYTECLRCEYQSEGVVSAGHDYKNTKWSWEPAPRKDSRALMAQAWDAAYNAQPAGVLEMPPPLYVEITQGQSNTLPPVEFASVAWSPDNTEYALQPLGNLAGHATHPRRKPAKVTPIRKPPNCKTCGEPKEATRPKSNLCRACDRKDKVRGGVSLEYPRKKQRKPWNTPCKIASIKPRKTSRKPSSKRSKTA